MPITGTTTTTLQERLKAIKAAASDARDARAAANADRDRHREAFAREGGPAAPSNPLFAALEGAAQRVSAAQVEVERLGEEERGLLLVLGRDAPDPGGPDGPRDAGHVSAATMQAPGGWLATAMHAEIGSGGMRAALTTAQVGSRDDVSRVFFSRLADVSAITAAVANVVDIETSSIRIPRLTGRLAAAAATPELAPMPESDPPYDVVDVAPPKYGVLTGLSVEAFRDARPPLLAATERELISAIARGFDAACFTGAATGPQPGLLTVTGSAVVDAAGALANLDVFVRAIGALRRSGAVPAAILMAPATWERLGLLKDESGSARPLVGGQPHAIADGPAERLLGLPVHLSEGCPAANALVVDTAELTIVRRQGVEVETFEHFNFASGEVGVRAIARLALVVNQPAGLARIDNLPVV